MDMWSKSVDHLQTFSSSQFDKGFNVNENNFFSRGHDKTALQGAGVRYIITCGLLFCQYQLNMCGISSK